MSQESTFSARIDRKIMTTAEPFMAPLRRRELNNLDFLLSFPIIVGVGEFKIIVNY